MSEDQNIPEENSQEQITNSTEEIANSTISQQEIIEQIEQPTTYNLPPTTENMEVHHHPHVEKKNFKEYFLEFLMIFLAVTMGFFAESYREHLSDGSKETAYIHSLLEDFKTDSAFLNASIHTLIPYHVKWMDSTKHLLQMQDIRNKNREVYQAFITATAWTYDFHPTERTLSQLHSEGFHLIRNPDASKAISNLEDQYKLFSPANSLFQNMQNDIDVAAYAFAEPGITGELFAKGFKNNKIFTLLLEDVPSTALIKLVNKDMLALYIDKMQKYSFYLQAAIKADYMNLLAEISKTLYLLRKEYNIKNE